MRSDWRNGRVLVTGGAGFIGSHLIEHLLTETTCEVVTMDRLSGSAELGRLPAIPCWPEKKRRVRFVWHDLKAQLSPAQVVRLGKFDAIFHLAASSHVDTSIADPALFVLDNVLGSTHLMMAAREMLEPDGLFFNFLTDEVFGPVLHGEPPRREEDVWRPSNPYSGSKAGQGAMGLAFWRTYGLPLVTTYSMNVFGERQHVEKYVPKLIRAVLRDEEIRIHTGAGGRLGSRTWLHAGNTAHALAHLCDVAKPGDAYSIVLPEEHDNLEMAELVAGILGKPLRHRLEPGDVSRPGYDARYSIDGARLMASGWKPPRSFTEALEATVRWTAEHPEWVGL